MLVGRRGARDEDFQEILLATTFMSTAECRNATDFNRVRCFHQGALVAPVAAGRWELVKVICTQPYSTHFPFGLSFVKVHAAAADDGIAASGSRSLVPATFLAATAAAAAAQTSAASPFAKFKMRSDSTESDGETSTLFSRWKQSKATNAGGSGSTAGAIRDASVSTSGTMTNNSPAARVMPKHTPKASVPDDNDEDVAADASQPKRADRNRQAIMYDSDDEKPNERLDRKLQHDRLEREKQAAAVKTTPANRKLSADSAQQQRSRTTERSSSKFQDFLAADVVNVVVSTPTTASSSSAHRPASAATKTESNQRFSPIANTSMSRKRTLSPTGSVTAAATQQTPLKKSRSTYATAVAAVAPVSRPVRTYKPFHKLLEGVVLVISGIQNPERGHLRDKALAMGAKYKPDWCDGCTHLM